MVKHKGERVPVRHGAYLKDVAEFREYLKGDWPKTRLPRVVKRWDVNVDEEYESLEFTGPLLDLKKLHHALDASGEVRSLWQTTAEGAPKLLLRFHGVSGPYEKNASGLAFPDYVEVSMRVPGPRRKKVFSMLPDFLVRTGLR